MDESLWESVNLLFKKVPIRFLELVIKNGCKYLSLFGAKLIGETKDFNQFWENIRELKRNKLVYLELMDCQVTENGDYLWSCFGINSGFLPFSSKTVIGKNVR